MSAARDLIADLVGQADLSFLGRVHAAVSVSPQRERQWMRGAKRPFVDPEAPDRPTADQLRSTARWVIDQSRFKLTLVGGVAGLGGAASVPPEVLASTIALLRLAQRLAIVYGFDPASDRGEAAVWRALASGFEVDLPGDGPVGMRVSQVPAVVVKGARARYPAGALAAAVLRETAWQISRRITRLLALPVLSSGFSAVNAHRRATRIGVRMLDTLGRLADAPPVDTALIEEAVEVV